jgi:hypothetical protein
MDGPAPIDAPLSDPRARAALGGVKVLVGGYLAISVLTFVAIVLLRNDASAVNDAVWVRGTIVVASALLMSAFAVRSARGSRKAYLRLRLTSGAMVVAIAVIVSLPGLFPLWMRAEQAVCGLVLLAVVVIVNGRRLRSAFAGRG